MNALTLMRINKALNKEMGGVRLELRDNPDRPVALVFEDENASEETQRYAAAIVSWYAPHVFYYDEARVTE